MALRNVPRCFGGGGTQTGLLSRFIRKLFEILDNLLKYNSKFNNSEKRSAFCTGWKACATKFLAVWRISRAILVPVGLGGGPQANNRGYRRRIKAPDLAKPTSYTNDHFLTDTTKDEKWLVLVGRPSLAALSVGGRGRPPHSRRPAPPGDFHIKWPSVEVIPTLGSQPT